MNDRIIPRAIIAYWIALACFVFWIAWQEPTSITPVTFDPDPVIMKYMDEKQQADYVEGLKRRKAEYDEQMRKLNADYASELMVFMML